MQAKWKQIGICLLAMLMLTGCQPSGGGQEETTANTTVGTTTVPTQTTAPIETTMETSVPESTGTGFWETIPNASSELLETSQIRLQNRKDGWGSAFVTDNGTFLLADSTEALLQGLSSRGVGTDALDLSGYDDDFFQSNRLAVIPCSSNSGSVRYQASVTLDGNTVSITLEGKVNGEGTTDMADWLVLVTLPFEKYPENTVVTVPAAYTKTSGNLEVS